MDEIRKKIEAYVKRYDALKNDIKKEISESLCYIHGRLQHERVEDYQVFDRKQQELELLLQEVEKMTSEEAQEALFAIVRS